MPGSPAPAFALRSSPHCDVALEDYRGRPIVLAFYIADWHPVCSAQLERYRDLGPELTRLGAELLAISSDTVWSHAAFARAYRLAFPLLADHTPRAKIARAYGAFDVQVQAPSRSLFVIDAKGVIAWSESFPESVDPGLDRILSALEGLPPATRQP